ncbi:hypothetical protein B0H13DRAFT_2262472 [Mycena leptocephala]|nr:hypothetical protein B0H13DRAFT_2262472 [Mycena leptocephala]
MSTIKTTHIAPIPKKLWLPVPPSPVMLRVQLATAAAVLSAFSDHDLTILSRLWPVVVCVDSPICDQFAVPIGLRLTEISKEGDILGEIEQQMRSGLLETERYDVERCSVEDKQLQRRESAVACANKYEQSDSG